MFIFKKKLIASLVVGTAMLGLLMSTANADMAMGGDTDRYGGPAYKGAPNLAATAAFVTAGGGADHFSFQTALVSMVGAPLVGAEVAKLQKQYGNDEVAQWLKTWDFAVGSALYTAGSAGVKIPAPADLQGHALAVALVTAGLAPDGTYWTGYMLDHTISNGIHNTTMDAIDKHFNPTDDANYHKITNQAMYDLAQALGAKTVKLAVYH